MGKIHALDTQLTNMIAAGEVVERPSGIVKELVENSIDAGSTSIEIRCVNGGIDSIEIIDDGCGMSFEDAAMAFERHATSKISTTDDLWSIHTLGFRGEALPSIASVSKLEMETCDGEDATRIVIEYGERKEYKASPCNEGTSIRITGLFYKTPARLKHLKSGSYENSLIQDIVQKFALSHPEISFSYISDGREAFKTSGTDDLLEVIFKIYGKDAAKSAMEISGKDYDFEVNGYLIHPSINRANRYAISVFMNNRMVRPYRIVKCVAESTSDYMPPDRYPIAVLNIKMDSRLVDVNVHPSKWEVRLSKEQQVELLIQECVKKALESQMKTQVVTVKQPVVQAVFEPVINKVEEPKVEYSPKVEEPKPVVEQIELLVEEPVSYEKIKEIREEEKVHPVFPELRVLGQLHKKFIVCEGVKGLYIIDQHAAQERVHFEEINERLENDKSDSIDCLIPLLVTVGDDMVAQVDEINKATESLQLHFEPFGNDSLMVRRIPVWMKDLEEQVFLQDLIDYYRQEKKLKHIELERHKIATMACHRSIRFNRTLTLGEMEMVVKELSACKQPFHCPHGRPTFLLLEDATFEREFLR